MNLLQRQIAATVRQIDRLVYEWYRLTEEEIGIVEDKIEVGVEHAPGFAEQYPISTAKGGLEHNAFSNQD